jgi:hypothetical protein
MDDESKLNKINPDPEIEAIDSAIWVLAEKNSGDPFALLTLLRHLELIHRRIRSELFEPCLPQTRQHLYQLVKEIEEAGGWPYIERMRLRQLLQKIQSEASEADELQQDKPV